MCGIAGIYSHLPVDREKMRHAIIRMTSCLRHRGPDDEGCHVGGNVALGHRRLSIIDVRSGRQPIYNEDRSVCIVFNGEIYNYREIRAELIEAGHRFSSNSDTETIVHAYEEWGVDCMRRLRGMFAFGIWDDRRKTLLLVRDRLGKKPLFFSQRNGAVAFASEMKAILADPCFKRSIDAEALASYFLFSYVPAPLTIYDGIRKLPPGHYALIKDGRVHVRKYWDLHFTPDRKKTEQEFEEEFMKLLEESVKIRLMSEVPLGAFLSGGVDSSTVVALMSGMNDTPVKTFTIGFDGGGGGFDDERKYAKLVAERYRTVYREHEVTPRASDLIETIVRSFDEPFADDSTIPSYYVCKMAREDVTVALSGLGGDEAFGGYERYLGFRLGEFYNRIPRGIRVNVISRLIEKMGEPSSGSYSVSRVKRFVRSASEDPAEQYLGFVSKLNNGYRNAFFNGRNTPEALDSAACSLKQIFNSDNAVEPLNKVFYTDIKTYLPEDILACTDRISMHHSLEVRTPFVDHTLLEFCATIPPHLKIKHFRKKYLLKRGVAHLLPQAVLSHKKQGFVGPMVQWLRTDLKAATLSLLSERNLAKHGLFNPGTIKKILDDHYAGRETNDSLIWSLLVFQTWFHLYME
jgi:asparagine synthase (glutamine-hydrolysing)